ncbi:MAG: CotH kinase family protein, partial [Clostridia bacterium]|nr:CotH kinase family protein [Clostridia bacterium]
PDILEHRKTDGGRKDDEAVIASLKILSQGRKMKKGLNTHEIIRYFAVHNFLLNYDSYTGTALHNMVICEKEGILNVMPWDYNLAFGTYVSGIGKEVLEDPTDFLNLGIDTPLIDAEEKDRPLWSWIMQKVKYRREYHDVLSDMVESYFESGQFEKEFKARQAMIAPYAEKDPNAFYSYEEFKIGCDVLRRFCLKRAESVRKQLNGELATDTSKQNDRDRVNASDLNVMDMGAYVFLP